MNFLSSKRSLKILAPMVGYSDHAWRILARRHGADLCYTEMVHAECFLNTKSNPVNNKWYTTNEIDRPLVVQICGNCPQKILEVAQCVQPHCDAIDINFGCPQNIAKKGNYGCFLQNDWNKIEQIVQKVSKNITIPLFCKIRIFEEIEKTVEYAKLFERSGCALLAVHGRTIIQKSQLSGLASWKHIKEIKKNLSIPVIANGNIIESSDLVDCFDYTNCDGVMVAETHLFNPCIFDGDNKNSIEIFKEYFEICESIGETKVVNLKNHAYKLFSPIFKKHSHLRTMLYGSKTTEDILLFLEKTELFVAENSEDHLLKLGFNLRGCSKTETSFFTET